MHILHTHTHTLNPSHRSEGGFPLSQWSTEPGQASTWGSYPVSLHCANATERAVRLRTPHTFLRAKGGPGALPNSDAFTSQVKALTEPVERTRSLNSDFLVKAALHPTLQYQGGKDILPGSCRERNKGWRKLLFGAYECLFLLRRIFQFGHRT